MTITDLHRSRNYTFFRHIVFMQIALNLHRYTGVEIVRFSDGLIFAYDSKSTQE